MPPTIVQLNGACCSGKSTLARSLLSVLERPAVHFEFDHFLTQQFPMQRFYNANRDHYWCDTWPRLVKGFFRAARVVGQEGVHVIVDLPLTTPWLVAQCLDIFSDCDVVLVGVRCSPEAARSRFSERWPAKTPQQIDDVTGHLVAQEERIHRHMIYDLQVDTSQSSASACAVQLRELIEGGSPREAFRQLRATYKVEPAAGADPAGRGAGKP